MKNKIILIGITCILLCLGVTIFSVISNKTIIHPLETVSLKQIQPTILATGTIESQNQAQLHFQTGGLLTYFPFKQGDSVSLGQIIATLDQRTVLKV